MTDPEVTTLAAEGDLDAPEGSGGGLANFLYPEPAARDSLSIIKWWEKRRVPYNLFVGGGGLATVGLVSLNSLLLPPGNGLTWEILYPIVAFGVMANICYTLGPTIEIIITKLWGREVRPVGPALFRMGLTFSLGLAFVAPAIFITMVTVVMTIARLFGA